MTTADRIVTEDRRLAILANLLPQPGYRLPLRTLQAKLGDAGYTVGGDRLRADCTWIESTHDALKLEGDLVTLTAYGADIAVGSVTVPGIGRPGPGA